VIAALQPRLTARRSQRPHLLELLDAAEPLRARQPPPKDRPTASTPLEWDEIEAASESGDATALVFTVDDLRRRVAAKGDFFAPLLTQKQGLPELSG
jgi:hypothetical protein